MNLHHQILWTLPAVIVVEGEICFKKLLIYLPKREGRSTFRVAKKTIEDLEQLFFGYSEGFVSCLFVYVSSNGTKFFIPWCTP
jgi:hypothetical protein